MAEAEVEVLSMFAPNVPPARIPSEGELCDHESVPAIVVDVFKEVLRL